ncbi:Peptidase M29, aminopeptidase II [Candidatus Omnitrophus magneticus]|uniref:Peptidase M29, aminopeptidase II n=1 Tax=Candidatus Omnitrophus magneticus TaxID=1609969 RepID=A0A0F0CVU5_9BACT|nr:Peptidase M29, aminopeptidase II [Candidatus Omnitrophus magneticus]
MIFKNAVTAVFERSLNLKKNETCLIVTDTIKESIAKVFFEYAQLNAKSAELIVIEPTKEHATEPPRNVSQKMLLYDVEILITDKSLTHTEARRSATQKGARIATMPGITEEIINRCMDIDYTALKRESNRIHAILKSAKKVRVTTKIGTDMTFYMGKTDFFGKDGGSFDYPGAYGNLPEGEVSFAPETCEGIYLVDASYPGLGILDSPITFKVKNGSVYEITGVNSDKVFERINSVGPKAFLVAELGIGLNPKAKIIGKILEDEKVIGTVHIATGNNLSYGGTNDVPIHLDGVITTPDIYVDNNPIMKSGRFI